MFGGFYNIHHKFARTKTKKEDHLWLTSLLSCDSKQNIWTEPMQGNVSEVKREDCNYQSQSHPLCVYDCCVSVCVCESVSVSVCVSVWVCVDSVTVSVSVSKCKCVCEKDS